MAFAQDGELFAAMAMLSVMAASHMSLPNYWLPYTIVGRAQGWTLGTTLLVALGGICGHVVTTMTITLMLSSIGGSLLSESAYRLFSSALLTLLGAYYLYTYFVGGVRGSCCESKRLVSASAAESEGNGEDVSIHQPILQQNSSLTASRRVAEDRAAAISVITLTALSPCIGSMPVLLSLATPPINWRLVPVAAMVLAVTCAVVMCSLIAATYVGAARLDFGRVRRHERLILGGGLILLGALTFLVFAKLHSHHGHIMPSEGGAAPGAPQIEKADMHGADRSGTRLFVDAAASDYSRHSDACAPHHHGHSGRRHPHHFHHHDREHHHHAED